MNTKSMRTIKTSFTKHYRPRSSRSEDGLMSST